MSPKRAAEPDRCECEIGNRLGDDGPEKVAIVVLLPTFDFLRAAFRAIGCPGSGSRRIRRLIGQRMQHPNQGNTVRNRVMDPHDHRRIAPRRFDQLIFPTRS